MSHFLGLLQTTSATQLAINPYTSSFTKQNLEVHTRNAWTSRNNATVWCIHTHRQKTDSLTCAPEIMAPRMWTSSVLRSGNSSMSDVWKQSAGENQTNNKNNTFLCTAPPKQRHTKHKHKIHVVLPWTNKQTNKEWSVYFSIHLDHKKAPRRWQQRQTSELQ
jgi:hypothetical protein